MFIPAVALLISVISTDTVAINSMRARAGELRGNTLAVQLEAREGKWYPDGPQQMVRTVAAFGEVGKGLQNPGPLIRVKQGTDVRVTLHNRLNVPMKIFGLGAKRGIRLDSVEIAANASHTFAFNASDAGFYYYTGKTSKSDVLDRDLYDSQLNGVIAVDEGEVASDDKLFLISWWGSLDSTKVSGLQDGATIVINGASWPHTERLHAVQGEAQRYRFINVTSSVHPLHLHGFYFRVDGLGNGATFTSFAPEQRQMAVTQVVSEGGAMSMTWTPTRPGNWVLHCHFAGHIATLASLNKDRRYPDAKQQHAAHDPHTHMMEAMVLGIHVEPRGEMKASTRDPRPMRLVAQSKPSIYGDYVGYAYSLDDTNTFNIPGPLLLLEKDEPVAINIVNKTHEPAGVHWHGIELESYPDGVPTFSGMGKNILPPIPAGDSLTVRFVPPRAGTFMYHSHMNEMQQIGSGMYGAIIVLPRGQKYDPEHDRVMLLSDNGPLVDLIKGPYPATLLNGSLKAEISDLRVGETYRFRIINIRADTRARLELMDGDKHVQWKVVARDGADLPAPQIVTKDANHLSAPGEILDVEFTPTKAGTLKLRYGYPRPTKELPASEVSVTVR